MSIRTFTVRNADKWMHQNNAQYTGDYIEGTLNDTYMLACKRGYCLVTPHYQNEWSNMIVYSFAAYKDTDACDELFTRFDSYLQADTDMRIEDLATWICRIADEYDANNIADDLSCEEIYEFTYETILNNTTWLLDYLHRLEYNKGCDEAARAADELEQLYYERLA